jgi:FkbM family methyltransferase
MLNISARAKRVLRGSNYARKIRDFYRNFSVDKKSAAQRFAELCTIMNIENLLDVGANVGQFGLDIKRHGFLHNIHSYEPVESAFQKLQRNSAKFANWNVEKLALGRAPGKHTINISGNDGLSTSFLKMGELHRRNFPESAYVSTEVVAIATVASELAKKTLLFSSTALKADVQGFEYEVLLGVGAQLNEIPLILIEVSLAPLYDGEPELIELLNLLQKNGHRVIDIFRGVQSGNGNLLQVDLITGNHITRQRLQTNNV